MPRPVFFRAAAVFAALFLIASAAPLRGGDSASVQEKWLARARAGEAEAQFQLGQLYMTSNELRFRRARDAEHWFRLAADQGHLGAILGLVDLYLSTPELQADAGDLAPYLERAAALGYTRSATELGAMLWSGERGLSMDRPRAFELLRASAKRGDELALILLATHSLDGVGLKRDPAKARELLTYAAHRGSLRARQQLKVLEPDARRLARPAEIIRRLNQLVKQGDAEAQLLLGLSELSDPAVIAEHINDSLTERMARSRERFKQASAQGLPEAATRLGIMLANGQGVTPDARAAAIEFERAVASDPLAQLNLAVLILDGKIPGADPARAVTLLESASSDNRDAAFELGMVYYEGRLRPRDLARASQLFEQAAARVHPKALVNLGVIAHNGEVGSADPVTAVRWWFLAAMAGSPEGQNMLHRAWPKLSAADQAAAIAQVKQWTATQVQARAAEFPALTLG